MPEYFDLMNSPLWVDHVVLRVRDLDRVAGFYERALGLSVLDQSAGTVTLGTSRPLLVLRGDPTLHANDPANAGLFHTAFLLPTRVDLANWLAHADRIGVELTGAADHGVSEAVYLDDPEGNGIEIYVDRPIGDWPYQGGELAMGNAPIDWADLATLRTAWSGFPRGGIVGHVHLQVGATDLAEQTLTGAFDLIVTQRYPSASFLGAGGYHHQLAVNTWRSRGAAQRQADQAGLDRVVLAGPGAAVDIADPWGTILTKRAG